METFDFVIVGGGSAGCVIANRLVQSGASVCVLEAGPVDRNPSANPRALAHLVAFDLYRWTLRVGRQGRPGSTARHR